LPTKGAMDRERTTTSIKQRTTRGVSHCGLVIYILKVSQGKRRIMETQIFHHAKI
jgi:hypothetical protein